MSSALTKNALADSLKGLLERKRLDKITVGDICTGCGISRVTFYYHFQDIYDLLEWTCERDASAALEGNRSARDWQQGFRQLMHAVLENRALIMNAYRSVSRERVERYLLPIARGLIDSVAREHALAAHVDPDDLEFVSEFFKYAFVGVMLEWIADGMRENPDAISEKVAFVMEGQVERALEQLEAGRGPSSLQSGPAVRNRDRAPSL